MSVVLRGCWDWWWFSHGGLDDKIILGKCENEKDKH